MKDKLALIAIIIFLIIIIIGLNIEVDYLSIQLLTMPIFKQGYTDPNPLLTFMVFKLTPIILSVTINLLSIWFIRSSYRFLTGKSDKL
jgi:hypothetical protein